MIICVLITQGPRGEPGINGIDGRHGQPGLPGLQVSASHYMSTCLDSGIVRACHCTEDSANKGTAPPTKTVFDLICADNAECLAIL